MSHSPTRRPAAGRPTFALGFVLALVIGLLAPVVLSPRSASAADKPSGRHSADASAASGADYTTTDLNLRSGPGLGYGVLLVMPPGAEVTRTGDEENGFAAVRYDDTHGWAFAEYLGGSAPAVSTEPAAASEPAAPAAGGGDVASLIYAAAAAYGQDGDALLAVASCESGLDPNAYNASFGASGLFQFLPGTWAGTPYGGSSVFDPAASANAAAWMWSVGRRGEWVC